MAIRLCGGAAVAGVFGLLLLGSVARADLKAGAARGDITPDVKAMEVPLGGYTARKGKPATGVHDPVYARALVLSNGNTKFGIVSVDLCFVPASVKEAVEKRLTEDGVTGLDAGHLLLAATHTHTAPDPLAMYARNTYAMQGWTTFSQKLLDFEAAKIADTIALADRRLIPARIATGTRDATGSNRNRRVGEKITDPTMTLLRVTDDQGRSLAAIVNFACHPTLYDDKMMEISAGWPGVMCGMLEKKMGGDAVALFLNGAEGDATTNGAVGNTPQDRVENFGNRLGEQAWEVLQLMQTKPDVPLKVWREEVVLPPHKPNGLFIVAARSFGASMEQAKLIVDALMPTKSTLGFFQVGDVLWMGFPCEPTGVLGLAAKAAARKAGFTTPAVVALADDWLAYALTPAQYHEGGYETGMSFFGDQLGPTLLTAVEKGLSAAP